MNTDASFWQQCAETSPANYFYDVQSQLRDWIYGISQEAFRKGEAQRDQIRSREQLKKRQKAIRQDFLKSIGGLPPFPKSFKSRTTGILSHQGGRIEKVIFEPRPHHYVTGSLYLPEGTSPQRPQGAVLFLCGHSEGAKQYSAYQSVCQTIAQTGLIVFAMDPVGQGERVSYLSPPEGKKAIPWGVQEHDHAGVQCQLIGDSLARYFLHDAMCAIDYLISRPEVDPTRIGLTGNSGGGTQASMLMMVDPRIAAAAPGTFIMNRETYQKAGGAQDAEQIWPGFTANGYDHEDILISMVPRPVQVLAVTYDFFPIEGTRKTVERTRRFWKMFGKEKSISLVEDASKHAYTISLARSAARFFALHFLGKKTFQFADPVPLPEKDLWCTNSGQVCHEFPDNEMAFEANRRRWRELPTPSKKLSKTSERWLRQQIFKGRKRCDLNPKIYEIYTANEIQAEAIIWWSQPQVLNHAILFSSPNSKGTSKLSLALWENGVRDLPQHIEWIESRLKRGESVAVVELSGMGSLEPNPLQKGRNPLAFYGVLHKFDDDLKWLGDSLAAVRVWDLLRAIDALQQGAGSRWNGVEVFALGRPSLYARLASLLDSRIRKVTFEGGIESYASLIQDKYYDSTEIKALVLPGVLRYLDV